MPQPIQYAEYKELVDILERSNPEHSYQDLMKKEEKVLDTVNNIVKYYTDYDTKENEFINQRLSVIIHRFFTTWLEIFRDIQNKQNIKTVFTKDDRMFYVGMMLMLVSVFLYIVRNLS